MLFKGPCRAIDGSIIGQPMKHGNPIKHGIFNRNGTRVLTWGGDVAKLWNASNGMLIRRPMKHASYINGA